jgi:hypothetical protein
MWRVGLAIVLLLAVGAGVSWAEPPANEPTGPSSPTGPSDEPDETPTVESTKAELARQELERLVAAMEMAETEEEVDKLFGQACSVDRDDASVNRTYLSRMLKFGQVQKGVYAARRLLKFDKSDGLAAATLTYYEADRGNLPLALPEAIRAASLLPEDPGVMYNAGALVAWFEHQDDPPVVSREVRQVMREELPGWKEEFTFADSYELISERMRIYEAQEADVAGEIAEIKSEIQPLEDDVDELMDSADDYSDNIKGYKERIRDLQREIKENTTSSSRDARLRRQISDYRDMIRRAERNRDPLLKRAKQKKREITALETRRRAAEREIQQIQQSKKDLFGTKTDRAILWELPLIDGERIDMEALKAARAEAAREARQTPSGDTSQAGKAMQMAKQYIRAGRKDLAIPLLEKVIALDPDSDLAEEADRLLRDLQ